MSITKQFGFLFVTPSQSTTVSPLVSSESSSTLTLTNFPEMMDGRVKTLHPRIHGGLLGRRGIDDAQMADHGIQPIDLVVVNLYPFEETVAKGAEYAEVIENIDIGGPALIRATAKNHAFTTIVIDPQQYQSVMVDMDAHKGCTSPELRQNLAATAYALIQRPRSSDSSDVLS